jgi:DNA-binding GntR family transcriptional regulator
MQCNIMQRTLYAPAYLIKMGMRFHSCIIAFTALSVLATIPRRTKVYRGALKGRLGARLQLIAAHLRLS